MSERDEHYARFFVDPYRSLSREVTEFEQPSYSPILGPDGRNIPLPPRQSAGFKIPTKGE